MLAPQAGQLVLKAAPEGGAGRQPGERILLQRQPGGFAAAQLGDVEGHRQHLARPPGAGIERRLAHHHASACRRPWSASRARACQWLAGLEALVVEHAALEREILAMALGQQLPHGVLAGDADRRS